MTITRYNKNFVYLEETKNLTKNEMKTKEYKDTKKINLVSLETKILKI